MKPTYISLISIIFFSLFISTSQKFLRKTEEEPLSICLPLDSSGGNNNEEGINIICSGNTCHGIINNGNEEKNNTLKNETLICNSKACIIKPKNNDDCIIQVSNCSNCSEIKLYCFNGYCVGGPSNNDGKNNNNGTSTNGSSTSGSSTSGSNNPSNDETITVISCLDGFCDKNKIDDIDENDGDSGIVCENGKCIFGGKKETPEEDKKDDNDNDNFKIYLAIGIGGFFIICIFFNFIFIFSCGNINFKNCKCTCYMFYMLFFAIIFAPFFLIYILICFCCEIKWYESKSVSNKNNSNNSNKNISNDINKNGINPVSSYNNIRSNSEIITLKELKEPDREYEKELEKEKKKIIIQIHSGFCDIIEFKGYYYLINNEEVKLVFLLYQSLKLVSKSISIYTFNIAQLDLIKKKFKKGTSHPKVILLDDDCTNFIFSDYILISYIDSEISEESKKKFPDFKPYLNSKIFFTDEFANYVLNNYTGKILYLVCNENYLKIPKKTLKEAIKPGKANIIPQGIIAEELQVPIVNRNYVSNEYNICFIIDNTGSMGSWINIIKDLCHNFFVEITEKFSEYNFYFACVLYADKPSIDSDKNFKIDFTKNEKEFKSNLEGISLQNGDDVAEDWVSGFKIALEELNWRNGTKLIFHIADAPQHGKLFNTDKKNDNFLNDENDIHGKELLKLIKKCSERNIKITGISIDKVCSFKVFQEEYQKVKGPKYEIIELNETELTKGNNFMNKKMFGIIENSINQNKAEKFI